MLFNSSGGQGAAKYADGWPRFATVSGMGGLRSAPVEEIELFYPILIERNEVETDAMGLGQWIGGPGLRTRYRPVDCDMDWHGVGEGLKNPPHGVNGGTMSPGGGIFIEHTDGRRTFTSSAGYVPIKEGEVWELTIPSKLAYGKRGAGKHIKPDAVLQFEIELVKICGRDAGLIEGLLNSLLVFNVVSLY